MTHVHSNRPAFGVPGKPACVLATLLVALIAAAQVTAPAPPATMPRPGVRFPRPVPGVAPAAPAATAPGTISPLAVPDASPNSLNFQEAATDLVLMEYAQRTKRTLLMTPNLPKPPITLRSNPASPLTDEEFLTAIEQILNLNGIALEPIGDKFLRVLASAELRKYAPKTSFPPEGVDISKDRYPENGSFVSRMVELKNIDIAEAKTVIDGFVRTGAQIQTFERSNSILVTDSTDNVNRILEVLGYIDRPIIAREEPNVIQIQFAKAVDIKTRLLEIVAEAESQAGGKTSAPTERQSGAPGTLIRPLPAGVTLPRGAARAGTPAAANATIESLVQDAERGVIRGKVQIIADERTNILIIITRPENMLFFNRIIKVLDIETAPDVAVEVFRLEHALAKDVATLLNDLIGNEKKDDSSAARTPPPGGPEGEKSQNLADFVQRRQAAVTSVASVDSATKTKVGKLDKENIKILADERSNALVIMASLSDMEAIRELITSVDIMLSQVLIETVLIGLNFEDSLETGVDWVQRALKTADSSGKPVLLFAGQGGGGSLTPADPLGMLSTPTVASEGAGLAYFLTALDLNLDVVLRAVASDSRARIMSAPVIMTQDNKEAVLEATVKRYFFKGKKYAGSGVEGGAVYEDDVEQQDVGLTLKVTPRINNKGYVVLTVEQTVDNIAGTQTVNGDEWPIVSSRKMGSDIAVNSGDTVVLGGLAENVITDTKSKIPILGDIPILGWLFRSTRKVKTRSEVVVFLTPRVLNNPADVEDEARNRKAYLDTEGVWRSDWSGSRLSDPISEKDRKLLLERGTHTLEIPRYPLTRELSPLNERYGLKPETVPAPETIVAPTSGTSQPIELPTPLVLPETWNSPATETTAPQATERPAPSGLPQAGNGPATETTVGGAAANAPGAPLSAGGVPEYGSSTGSTPATARPQEVIEASTPATPAVETAPPTEAAEVPASTTLVP